MYSKTIRNLFFFYYCFLVLLPENTWKEPLLCQYSLSVSPIVANDSDVFMNVMHFSVYLYTSQIHLKSDQLGNLLASHIFPSVPSVPFRSTEEFYFQEDEALMSPQESLFRDVQSTKDELRRCLKV